MCEKSKALVHLAAGLILMTNGFAAHAAPPNCAPVVDGLKLEHLLTQTFDENAADYIGDLRRVAWDAIHLEGGAYRKAIAEGFIRLHPEFPDIPEAEFFDWVHRRVWTTMARDKEHGHRLPKVERLHALVQEVIEIQRKFAQP